MSFCVFLNACLSRSHFRFYMSFFSYNCSPLMYLLVVFLNYFFTGVLILGFINFLSVSWISGWHICSTCRKASYYVCYTCTYSLCKGCIKDADYLCVRGNKGLCAACMKTIMMMEDTAALNQETVCLILSFLA